jgi:hypothetical protein
MQIQFRTQPVSMMKHELCANAVLSTLCVLFHLIPTNLQDRYYYNPVAEMRKLKNINVK